MIRKRIIKTEHLKVGALEWGYSSPKKILALHGWLDNANSFLPLAPYLKDYHVVAIDLVGHGLSDHRPKGTAYHFIDAVTYVHEVIDALGWNSCTLLGHSMGGGISVLASATYPNRIEKLVLVEALGPFSRDPEVGPEFLLKHIHSTLELKKKKVPTYKKFEEAVKARKAASDFTYEVSEILCKRGLKKTGLKWTWRSDPRLRVESPMRLSEEQVQAYIKRITSPTLLIVGSNGLRFDPKLMEERKNLLKNLTFQTLEGGHHVHMEKPAQAGRLISDFLK